MFPKSTRHVCLFFFSSRRRHTRFDCDWSSDVCSSDLGNGREYGIERLQYGYQDKAGGIAEALALAEHFVGRDKVCVMLADNIFERSLASVVQNFANQDSGARIVLSRVDEDEHLRH